MSANLNQNCIINTPTDLDPSPHCFLLFLSNHNDDKLRCLFPETLDKGKTKEKIQLKFQSWKKFKVSSVASLYRKLGPREAKSSMHSFIHSYNALVLNTVLMLDAKINVSERVQNLVAEWVKKIISAQIAAESSTQSFPCCPGVLILPAQVFSSLIYDRKP